MFNQRLKMEFILYYLIIASNMKGRILADHREPHKHHVHPEPLPMAERTCARCAVPITNEEEMICKEGQYFCCANCSNPVK